MELRGRREAQYRPVSGASSCTRIDTLRYALQQRGAARQGMLFTLSAASTDYPQVRQVVWRLYLPKRKAKS